ncbi:hypothetical protein EB796_022461 [Bugula neritina]|uniref:Uncharacterized protein n=1 Tax=Bugula neritina TaxID=10212 RepID=A0A7J7J0R5_BUGNE|nr:hypothetical protein EB796_022461 [Bugula neritina]
MSPVFSRSCRFQAHTAVSIVLFLVYQFTLLNCSQICSDASTACDLTPQQSLASQEDCISPILSSSAQLKEPQWGQDSVFKPQNANVCSKCCALPSNVDKTSACVGALNISAVGIKLVNYQHQLYVRFTSISYHGCQYSLTLKSLTNPSNALCKFYDVKYTQQVSFIDECFVELEANHTYDLNITNQESGYVRLYRFFSPSTLVTDDDISPGGIDWQPLTAITIYDKHIEVYIQRLPQPFPPYYVLELHYTNSDGIHLQGTLTRWLDGVSHQWLSCR